MFFTKLKEVLESKYFIMFPLSIGFLFWLLNLTSIGVCLLAIITLLILVFCDNINNLFAVIFYVPFFIEDIAENIDYVAYGIALGILVIGLIFFVIKQLVFKKAKVTKGKMFWAFIVSTIAFLLGGIFTNFNLIAFFATFALSILTYTLYFLAVNFTKDLFNHIAHIFIYGTIVICLEITIKLSIEFDLDLLFAISHRDFAWFASANVNECAIFITAGMISAFLLGYKNKFDYLYFLLAIVFEFFVCTTYCRTMILLSVIVFVGLFIYSIIKSRKKLNYLWVILGCIIFIILTTLFNYENVVNLFLKLENKVDQGSNGRDTLWQWCWSKFQENKLLGFGFVTDESIPGVRDVISVICAHNTLLQWLTSCGIVGTILILYAYITKYNIVITKSNSKNIFITIIIITIELSGIFDQAATMNYFIYLIPFILIATLEISPRKKKKVIQQTKK